MRVMRTAAVATIALCGLLAAPVAQSQQGPATRQEGSPMPEKSIETVLKAHTPHLMSLPGVVGTALGECAGTPCIKVFVVERTPELLEQIPPALEGYPVVVDETGEIRALEPN